MQFQHSHQQQNAVAFIFISLLLIVSMIAFWPGTTGGFWFDDEPALDDMAINGSVNDGKSFVDYVFGGTTSLIGRPVSQASFLLDSQTWPAEPGPFKYSNLMFHVLNGILFFGFIFYLLKTIGQPRYQALSIAFLGSMLWTVHPLQVSTVAYIVQRMTELSALFLLLSIWCYIHGRKKLIHRPAAGYYWMTLGMGFFGMLSILSKENGLLIPVLILVLEATLLNQWARPAHWKYWAIPSLGLPVLILVFYFTFYAFNHADHYALRDFNIYERFMTQGRVIFSYLGSLLWPVKTPTLFYDNYIVSKGLFNPISTIISIVALASALVWAWLKRKKYPFISFAILWYLAAQLLESSIINLEIYFEHRNYIPLFGPALAAAYYLQQLCQRAPKFGLPITAFLLTVISFTTWQHSSTWGDDHKLAKSWVEDNPTSIRARVILATYEMKQVMLPLALESSKPTAKIDPQHLGAQLSYISAACINNRLEKEEYIAIQADARTKRVDTETFSALARLYYFVTEGHCRQVSLVGLLKIIDNLLANPSSAHRSWVMGNMYRMKSAVSQQLQLFDPTVNALTQAFEIAPQVKTLLRLAQLNASFGRIEIAEKYLSNAYILDDLRARFKTSDKKSIDEIKEYIETVKSESVPG